MPETLNCVLHQGLTAEKINEGTVSDKGAKGCLSPVVLINPCLLQHCSSLPLFRIFDSEYLINVKYKTDFISHTLPFLLTFLFLSSTITAQNDFRSLDSLFNLRVRTHPPDSLSVILDKMEPLVTSPKSAAKLDMYRGIYYFQNAEFSTALSFIDKALSVFETLKDTTSVMRCQVYQVHCFSKVGEMEKAEQVGKLLVKTSDMLPPSNATINAYRIRGYQYRTTGKLDSAVLLQARASKAALELGDSLNYAHTVEEVAGIYFLQGKNKPALQTIGQLTDMIDNISNLGIKLQYFSLRGMILTNLKRYEAGEQALQTGFEIAKKAQLKDYIAGFHNNLGINSKLRGDTLGAIQHFTMSMEMSVAMNDLSSIGTTSSSLAKLYLATGQLRQANRYALDALYYGKKLNSIENEAFAMRYLGEIHVLKEAPDSAISYLEHADSLAREIRNWPLIIEVQTLLSQVYESQQLLEAALQSQRLVASARDSFEFLEAQKYADSLRLSQQWELDSAAMTVVNSETLEVGEGNKLPWILLLSGCVGLMALVLIFRKKKKIPVTSTSEAESGPDPNSIATALADLRDDKDWAKFMLQFDALYPGLLAKIGSTQQVDITPTDLRILTLTRLGLSNHESAEILGISPDSAKKARYRTRKRLQLTSDQTLLKYMFQIENGEGAKSRDGQ